MKNKRRLIQRFNLIEIVVALGVAALGMTAVVAMLPSSLNAHKNSVGDSTATMISAEIENYVNTFSERFNAANPNNWYSNMTNVFDTSCPSISDYDDEVFENTDTSLPEPFSRFFMSKKNIWYYLEQPTAEPDTELKDYILAKIMIWVAPLNDVYDSDANANITVNASSTRPALRVFYCISWPANADYEHQQHRFFVHDIARPLKERTRKY